MKALLHVQSIMQNKVPIQLFGPWLEPFPSLKLGAFVSLVRSSDSFRKPSGTREGELPAAFSLRHPRHAVSARTAPLSRKAGTRETPARLAKEMAPPRVKRYFILRSALLRNLRVEK